MNRPKPRRAQACLEKLLLHYEFTSVLDWGCGLDQPHREAFEGMHKRWAGYDNACGWVGDARAFAAIARAAQRFDCIWCSHVLEHLYNPVETLADFRVCIKDGGILAVTVPAWNHRVVGGHIHGGYTAGHLLYQLVLAGFDCSQAAVGTFGWEISVIVRKPEQPIALPNLKHDAGDIELLAPWLPDGCKQQGFDGRIERMNW